MTNLDVIRLFHTVRYLKPIQLYRRFLLQFKGRQCPSREIPTSIETIPTVLEEAIERPVSYQGNRFRFLNRSIHFTGPMEWNKPDAGKLWLYNLHYFDFLQQPGLNTETALALMEAWTKDNPPCEGNGWEPYPLSLRIVNWIKFLRRGSLEETRRETLERSLFRQSRVLRYNLEHHLLGNHLFKNAVALLFAGCSFAGDEAEEWYRKGREILIDQLAEQILNDGGHFERSPMYHALILEDVLDCLNLIRADRQFRDGELESRLETQACAMLGFLLDILHPDGSLPLFNDTAQGIASDAKAIAAYAGRLGIAYSARKQPIVQKEEFGLYVLSKGEWRCVIDAGRIGPDYLPGHAHCDTLSYELALADRLIVVNAGVFQYAGDERSKYRATRSHNTVEIDEEEQHEIWSIFRVARRGVPQSVSVGERGRELVFSGQHTGYRRLRGKPIHRRDLQLSHKELRITDRIIGKGVHLARSFVHLHPSVKILSEGKTGVGMQSGSVGIDLAVLDDCEWRVSTYDYSPEFGLKQPAHVVVIEKTAEAEFEMSYAIRLKSS